MIWDLQQARSCGKGDSKLVKCAAILLSAGKSTRMESLKALLPWKGTTLLQFQLSQFNQSKVEQIIVVLGCQASKLLPYIECPPIQWVWNEDFEKGKTESIKRGVQSINENSDCFIIASVDQPINQLLIDEMIHQFQQTKSKIIIPVYKGKRGHPVLFSSELLEELLYINEETLGLKAVIKRRKNDIHELTVEDRSILFNFNEPKDYEAGLREERAKYDGHF